MTAVPTFSDFIAHRFGKNWVIAPRRTDRLVSKYGDDVKVVTQARYRLCKQDYRILYGDPNDAVRAELYRALVAAAAGLYALTHSHPLRVRINAALQAERDAR